MTPGLLRKDLRYAALWFAGAMLLFMIMLTIGLSARLMDAVDHITDDWVVHILGFMVITIAFCGPLQQRFRNKVFIGALVFGVLIEIVQLMIPYRTASLIDMSANLLGLALGWLYLRSKYGDWCLGLEKLLRLQ
jgi:glycopeptide antibiotics resistance protein